MMYKGLNILLFAFFVATSPGFTQNDTNQKYKNYEKRLIHPNRHIFSLIASNNQYPLILRNPSGLLQQNFTRGFDSFTLLDALYINYQYTLNDNFFVETGFKYLKYNYGYETNNWMVKYGQTSAFASLYSTFSFDFGSGYRVVVNNNLRLFDVHAGVSIGITDNPVGSGGSFNASSEYTDGMGSEGIFEINSSYSITNRINFGTYFVLSKDIRITDNLYLTARYHRHFGQRSEISEHTINYSLSTLNIQNEVRANLTAKGEMYGVGLRWVFDK